MLFKNIELNGKMWCQFCFDETSTTSESTRGVLSKLKKNNYYLLFTVMTII